MSVQVDSHQHFWTLDRGDYGWLTPEAGPIYRDRQPADLLPLLRDAGVNRTILVQAAPTVEETRYLLGIAREQHFVAGVVGWVDMDRPGQALNDLERFARDSLFRGIRPMIQDIDNADWVLEPAPATVFESLIGLDLKFDALVRPMHLPAILKLLARYPELPAVIDHGAKPEIAARRWQPWADHMARLGEDTGAFCKISGLLNEARATDGYEELCPYMEHLYRCFGSRRLMWGSDWPVLNLAGGDMTETSPASAGSRSGRTDHARRSGAPASGYGRWHRLVQRWLTTLGGVAKSSIQGETATRFYALPRAADGD